MKRLGVVLLCIALLGGCWQERKKKREETEKAQLADAQREARHNPDKFESSDDPPISADTYFAAGQLMEAQGDLAGAIKQYQQALKIDPKHRSALFRMGLVYTSMKSFSDAIATWQRYLVVTNNSPEAYNNLALCYEQDDKLAEAEQTFKAGIARDPDARTTRINYGLMLARHGRMQEAAAQLATALSPAEVQYNLGSVFEEQGKLVEAKACYHKALEIDPNLKDAQTRLSAMK